MKTLPLQLVPILALTFNFFTGLAPAVPGTAPAALTTDKLSAANNNMIQWMAERPLTWDDFMSEPQIEGDAVASTSTSLGLFYQVRNGLLTYQISCQFAKDKSWGSLRSGYILAHEQAHFDITEIHARKLYQALYNYKYKAATFAKDIDKIYKRIVKEKEAMQANYDGETDHSRRRKMQQQWLEKIDKMLVKSKDFRNYPCL